MYGQPPLYGRRQVPNSKDTVYKMTFKRRLTLNYNDWAIPIFTCKPPTDDKLCPGKGLELKNGFCPGDQMTWRVSNSLDISAFSSNPYIFRPGGQCKKNKKQSVQGVLLVFLQFVISGGCTGI